MDFNGSILKNFTPEDLLMFLYDFYHKFLSGMLMVHPRRMKTGINLQR